MKALLEIQSGSEQGRQLWLEAGQTLGRRGADVLIADPKISGIHAEVLNENHRLYLKDRQSTHGLWNPSEKVLQLPLDEGATFQMGDTLFKVLELQATAWDTAVRHMLEALQNAPSPPAQMRPFPALLGLTFLQGPHEGEVWPLGYGPRTIGTSSFDLYLYDPEAREECFTLDCKDQQVVLTTPHSHFVTVNDQFVQSTPLNPGDVVGLGQTLIKVAVLSEEPRQEGEPI